MSQKKLSLACRLFLRCYAALWTMAKPILRRNKRMTEGFHQRLVPTNWCQPADIWIQAASGGEAYLALQLVQAWEKLDAIPHTTRVLITSCTRQGMEVLEKAHTLGLPHLHIQTQFFPLDTPQAMNSALQQSQAKLLVLLETELWPTLLAECKKRTIPVLILNGRLSPKSSRAYCLLPTIWNELAPKKILAISQADAQRFSQIFPQSSISTMHNIKFDRIPTAHDAKKEHNPLLEKLLPRDTPIIVLGSIRRQEIPAICQIIKKIVAAEQPLSIILAPRHLHYVQEMQRSIDSVIKTRQDQSISLVTRSQLASSKNTDNLKNKAKKQIILWDSFGELQYLYAHAHAVFVGGSLAPLGGQNFLEVLEHGLRPCIGPFWGNFAWVGEKIVTSGLVQEAATPEMAATLLLQRIATPDNRETIYQDFQNYIAPKRGGSLLAAKTMQEYLFPRQK